MDPFSSNVEFRVNGRWSSNLMKKLTRVGHSYYEFDLDDKEAAVGNGSKHVVPVNMKILFGTSEESLVVRIARFNVEDTADATVHGAWYVDDGVFNLRLDSEQHPAFWMDMTFAIEIADCAGMCRTMSVVG